MDPDVIESGQTLAHLGGNFSIDASQVNVTANAPDNEATSEVFGLNIGLGGGGDQALPVRAAHVTEAYVADGADFTITGGAAAFLANATGTARADQLDISISLLSIDAISSQATVEGRTRAFVGANARLQSGDASFTAQSTGNSAVADLNDVSVGLGGGASLEPRATVAHAVEAFIAGGANVAAGDVALAARYGADADADVDRTGVSFVEITNVDPTVEARGDTKAFVDGTVTVADLTLSAESTRTADADTVMVNIGLLGSGAAADATVRVSGTTEAYFGSPARITASGNVSANASAANQATADSDGGSGGIIAAGFMASNAEVTATTRAYYGANAEVLGAANIELQAAATNNGAADTTVGAGGVIEVRGSTAEVTVAPTVEASVGSGVAMSGVGGSLSLRADSLRAEGDAAAKSYGGGAVDVGAANSRAHVNPTVNAFIDTGATIDVGGAVRVEALAQTQPAQSFDDTFTPDQATIEADTITFPSHGLASGDTVTYNPNGNTPIATADGGSLSTVREYSVIATGDDTLQLGATFDAGAADSSDLFAPQAGVDAARDRIRFAVPHLFLTGDAVKYDADGTPVSTSLNETGTFFVRRLDDFAIKLYATRDEAVGAAGFADRAFGAGAVDATNDRCTIFGHGFADNQAVTYRAAPPREFTSSLVDVTVAGDTVTDVDNNRIFIDNHGFSNGTRVIYRNSENASAMGLTVGTAYYVIVLDSDNIQLAATPEAADPDDGDDDVEITPIALTPDKSSPANQVRHMLVRESIGGLEDGKTYFVRNPEANTFQLAETVNGAPITGLDGANRFGTHFIGRAGLDLTGQSGAHRLRLDLTSAPGGQHLLLGPDGVSLRTLSPPPGDGESSSSAKGGGGGFVAVGDPDGVLDFTQRVDAHIAAARLNAGGNVTIRTLSDGDLSAYGSNTGGGFVATGNADGEVHANHTNRAYIGTNDGSGIIADGVVITAGGHLSIEADSSLEADTTSNADGGGFVASVDADSVGEVSDATQAVVGTNAAVTARSVSMLSQWTRISVDYDADATAGGAFGSADATSSGTVHADALTAIRAGAAVTGFEGVDLRAVSRGPGIDESDVDGDFFGIGPGDSNPDASYSPNTLIDTDPGALVTAGPRIFPGAGVPPEDETPLEQPAGFDRLALFAEIDAHDGSRDIAWDADVILLPGPNPTLVVGPDGRIIKAINVAVVGVGSAIGSFVDPDNNGSFTVDNIINDNDRGQALFRSNDTGDSNIVTVLPDGPLFTFRETYVAVDILNQSELDMVILDIEVVNTFLSTPEDEVTIEVDHVDNFEFDVNHDFAPTLIEIANTFDLDDAPQPDITFAGVVNNPIGWTHVFNARGDILSSLPGGGEFPTPPGLIRTDSFRIEAVLGSVGRNDSQRLQMELVESNDGPADHYRTSDAGQRNYMGLRGLLRRELLAGEVLGFDVDVDRIQSGIGRSLDVNLELYNGRFQPTVIPGPYEIEVFEPAIVNTPIDPPGPPGAPPRTTVVTDHFRQSPGTVPTIFPRGVWGEGFGLTEAQYVIGQPLDAQRRIISGANIDIVGVVAPGGAPFINVLGWTDLIGNGFLGIENIDVLTNGHITLTEELGNMRVGRIESTARDVHLTGRLADIIDAPDDPDEADVVGVNLRFDAPSGRVGTFENALEIDSSRPLDGVVKGDALSDIVLVETALDMNVDRIRSESGDVSLTTRDGSILDAFDDVEADSIGVNLIFTANAGRIGDSDNDFDIDSSTARPGRLTATASSSVFLTETDSSLNVQQVLSPGGFIRLTVPDTVATDEDLILMEGAIILSNEADISLRIGDDIDTRLESAMFTPSDIDIIGDFGDADPGIGSRIVLRGAMIADRTTINTQRDPDEIRIENRILNTFIFSSGGDDLIFGSDAGADDPDLNDTTYFGDFIDAGPGNDRIYGLGGADTIFGLDGDDFIDGGANGDFIDGGLGDDDLRGGFGNDLIHGQAGFDDIDGGRDNDILFGEDDDDRIHAGGGGINIIFGGAGDDFLEGSDEGRDGIDGGPGRDYIFGYGANDVLAGGADDDIIDGGAGDDIIQGGPGRDVLLGGADHDSMSGDDAAAGDDNAVDYVYGDFGTNLDEPGSGRDRLTGNGGNDLLFGEGEDDEIIDALGASNLIDAGAGDDPNVIVLAPATPNPTVEVSPDDPFAVNTLPSGPTYAGWWAEIAGSATGFGLSGGVGAALDTTVAVDAAGVRYAAWADSRNGNYEIYVARATALGWDMIGGSAAGGGVSDSQTDSRQPALMIFDGRPTVVWTEASANGTDIMGAQYDAGTDTWVTLGNSLLPGGISTTARADRPQILEADGRILVTWVDTSSQTAQVYARVFDGASWVEITPGSASGLGITQARPPVQEYDVAAEGSNIAVTWSAGFGDDMEVFARVREGASWVGLGSSASSGGLSDTPTESREPDAAWLDGQLFVAYRERVADFEQIFVKTFTGGAWVSAGPDGAVKQGVSDTLRRSLDPKLESGGGELFLVWVEHDNADYADPDASIFAKRWDGTQFVETLPGDASGGGISATGGKLSALDLAVDADGRPTVGWTDDTSGLPQAYLRTVTGLPEQVFVVNAATTVQAVLDANDLGVGDFVVLAPGLHAGFTLEADDAGVTILGAQGGGSTVTGPVTVEADGVLQRLNLFAGVTIADVTSAVALVDNAIGGGGLVVEGGSGLQILHNRFYGDTGITLAAEASGLIAHNDVFAGDIGLRIDAAFGGDIRDNDIRNATLGVLYGAAAPLNANRIHDNTVGVRSTIGGTTDALGFLAGSLPNEIGSNDTGVELVDAQMQNQRLIGNTTGVSGSGILGGIELDQANVIEGGQVGVSAFDGTIQFNRIGANRFGIVAESDSRIENNHIYRNAQIGISIAGESGVHIEGNTMYTPSGDLVRLTGGASDVSVLRNTLWTEDGYDLFVANDSQSGFESDFNNLYASGNGKVGFWTRDFTDVLDWQADIARFDLNSFGATVVNPDWARPHFESRHNDQYGLMPMFGTQRFTSPGAAPEAGVEHIALRTPDLYVDAVRSRALPIRWESFENSAGSAVRIDLYQDTPDGPAFLTTIAASTPDDGEFLWTPESSGIAFGTHGLRIQVSWVDNALVLDRSQEPFTVPEDGSDYFVDDHSNVDDEYTPNGIGDNRHTGKISSAPKPYLTNLVRVYDLVAGDRVMVDTGVYSMIDPVAISGSTDLGLGLDQSFLITGPTSTARVAELFPAIPGDRSRPLIELDDADGMTIEHLTLRDAERGLYAHSGSDGLSARFITALGHALDGIRLETDSPAGDFADLSSVDNGGYGIYLDGAIGSLQSSAALQNAAGGIFVNGPIDTITNNAAAGNTGYGFEIIDPGAATIQRNAAFGNTRGMRVDNEGAPAPALVGSTTLAPLTANRIWENELSGLEALGSVTDAGNTVVDQNDASATGIALAGGATAQSNVVRGNGVGIDAVGGTVLGNRVYGNRAIGIRGEGTDVLENVVYTNPVGVNVSGDGVLVRNNLVYDSEAVGLRVQGGAGTEILNNTLFELTADDVRIGDGAQDTVLRNNILWAQDGSGIVVAPDSQSGFASDYNIFFRSLSGTGEIGVWDGVARATLADWRAATGTDTDSLFVNPLFVDANGADNVLGFVDGSSDGRDDDFHVRSQFGSFHGGALAPVEGPSIFGPGAPVALVAVETIDAQQSPAIDRGHPDDPFLREPLPNGGYINIGAYGNTEQASKSPDEFIIVIAPNGGETIKQTATFDIRWHHALGTTVDIEYSSTGPGGTFTTLAANEANDGLYEWTVDPALFPVGDDYIIRVRSSTDPAISDRSDAPFTIALAPLQVTSLTPTSSGFAVRFNRALDPSVLNLYDGGGAGLGLADVVLDGPTDEVRGSIVLDDDDTGFVFVKTGAPLDDGEYTLTLTSGAAAFLALDGDLLDGNADGIEGDDFVTTFAVAATGAHVGIADFARGPEQEAGVASGAGVPLHMTGVGMFTTASFEIHFDPALLQVTGITDPAGGAATIDLSTAGIAAIDVTFDAPVSGDDLELGRLLATVPATAGYGSKQLLDIANVVVDGDAASVQDDDGIHVVAYIGDTTGEARYSSLDAQRIQRVIVRLDTGFSAYPLADPLIVGDVNATGRLESIDALLIQRHIVRIPVPEIPELPASPPVVFRSGPDPVVSLGSVPNALPGEIVTLPVNLDTAAGLESAQVRIRYDADTFEVVDVRRGELTADFGWFIKQEAPGTLSVDMSRMSALSGGSGSLLDVDLRVNPTAASGRHAIDLEWASLNEDALTLNPAPKAGQDPTDATVQVSRRAVFGWESAFHPGPALAPTNPGTDDRSVTTIAPVIDWRAKPAAASHGASDWASKPWVNDLTTRLGHSEEEANPNAGIRIAAVPDAMLAKAASISRGVRL
jgi:parallel beta-helix repeat protein